MRPDPGETAAKFTAIAAVLLFTTEPTDRALQGWNPDGWADEEMAAIRGFTSAATETAG